LLVSSHQIKYFVRSTNVIMCTYINARTTQAKNYCVGNGNVDILITIASVTFAFIQGYLHVRNTYPVYSLSSSMFNTNTIYCMWATDMFSINCIFVA